METRNCTSCKGTGKSSWMDRICGSCKGTGTFSELDIPAIIEAIKGRKGLRSKAPAYCGKTREIAEAGMAVEQRRAIARDERCAA